MKKVNRDYDYYISEARKAEDGSHGLWKGINQCIRSVLESQKKAGTPLSKIPKILREIAGVKKKHTGDMVALDNFRIVAKQIELGKEFSV